MKAIRILSLFIFLLILASCSSTRVRSDYDDRADFRALRTYAWIDPDDVAKYVRKAVQGILKKFPPDN